MNPEACGRAIRQLIEDAGLPLKVAVITGDDLMPKLDQVLASEPAEMFTGEPTPPRDAIASANAYLGAFPVAEALNQGADIVVTGRCVDSAVTLGACIHRFGWQRNDLDLLAAGSLAGHLIECGPQATGGNYTDWQEVADTLHEVGYPIAEIAADGGVVMTKPQGTGGCVTIGTVGEQLLYEIGDPAAYYLPDVICDFTQVALEQVDQDRVSVAGARGRGVPAQYKTSMTWADGWRAGMIGFYVGARAAKRPAFLRMRRFSARGASFRRWVRQIMWMCVSKWSGMKATGARRPVMSEAAKSPSRSLAGTLIGARRTFLMRELAGVGLGAPAGFCAFAGTRPKSSPVIRLFSILASIAISLIFDPYRGPVSVFSDSVEATETLSTPSRIHRYRILEENPQR